MDDEWSKQFFRSLGAIAQDTEQWFQQVTDHLAEASETVLQVADEWANEVQESIEPGLNQFLENLDRTVEPLGTVVNAQVDEVANQIEQVIDPLLTTLVSGLGQWLETVSAPINSTVDPILQNHPACVGCRNYCGQAYGGNLLVCAMYPYGPEAEQCPDWESIWPPQDSKG